MNGDHTVMVEILNAIEHGTLSVNETRRRLEELIDIEIQKTNVPANMQLVEECEKLLWELNTKGKMPYVSNAAVNLPTVLNRVKKQQRISSVKRYSLRVISAVAAMFIVIIGTEALFHKEWLKTMTSSDSEQFIIAGEVVDPKLIQEGRAADNRNNDELRTASFSQALEFAEGHLHILSTLSNNWYASYYRGIKDEKRIRLASIYNNQYDQVLTIDATWFADIQEAHIAFEQNEDGSRIVQNGLEIYIANNIDSLVCIWMLDQSVYTLSGTIDTFEAMQIIEELSGGQNHDSSSV